jgi:hypothetical protein
MKAVVYGRYGSPDVLELTGIDQAVVGDDQVLVRVRVVSPAAAGAERASGGRCEGTAECTGVKLPWRQGK